MTAVSGISTPVVLATSTTDPEGMIASLEQQIGDMQLSSGRSRAEQLSTNRSAMLAKARKALREAMDAKEESGFWSKLAGKVKTVATVATVVAAAAAIGTGAGAPAGLALAAVACSAGSFAMKETGLDTKVTTLSIGDAKVDLKLSDCVALAGVAFGVGGAASAVGATGSPAAQCVTELHVACKFVQTSAEAAKVGATGAQAVFTAKAGDASADAVELQADSREATGRADEAQSQIENQIDILRGVMETRRKIKEAVGKVMEQRHVTVVRLLEVRA